MISLLLAASLYQAAATAGERDVPVDLPAVYEASARDAVWLGATGAADIYSGAIALHRCPTCLEANPILPTPEARIAFKAGYTVLAWGAIRKLRLDGHDHLANVLRWCVVSLNLALTANNTRHAIRGY